MDIQSYLSDISTDELKAEIKRRQIEIRKNRPHSKPEYAYATAEVTYAKGRTFTEMKFRIKILDEWAAKHHHPWSDVTIDRTVFKAAYHPEVGDIVKIKSRKTKEAPDGFGIFSNIMICEIIKRAE